MLIANTGYSQVNKEEFQFLVYDWRAFAQNLENNPDELNKYCSDDAYNESVSKIFRELHKYDVKILKNLKDKTASASEASNAEDRWSTNKVIKEFQRNHSISIILLKMIKLCDQLEAIDQNPQDSNDMKLSLYTEIKQLVRHIDKKIEIIENHIDSI